MTGIGTLYKTDTCNSRDIGCQRVHGCRVAHHWILGMHDGHSAVRAGQVAASPRMIRQLFFQKFSQVAGCASNFAFALKIHVVMIRLFVAILLIRQAAMEDVFSPHRFFAQFLKSFNNKTGWGHHFQAE